MNWSDVVARKGAEVAVNVLLFIFSVLHCAAVGETAVKTKCAWLHG